METDIEGWFMDEGINVSDEDYDKIETYVEELEQQILADEEEYIKTEVRYMIKKLERNSQSNEKTDKENGTQ